MSEHQELRFDAVRMLARAPEVRDASGLEDGIGVMSGHFSTFNEWYRVDSMWEGEFLERMAPVAFTDTIANDLDGMRVLFDHGYDPTLGNKVLGPIRSLTEDAIGPAFEVPLFDTSYNRDLLPGLRSGVYGSSFRFRVQEDSWNDEPDPSDTNPKGLPERTITKAKVMEFGPVTFPANPSATAGVRSTTDVYYDRLRTLDSRRYEDACRARGGAPGATNDSREMVRQLVRAGYAPDLAVHFVAEPAKHRRALQDEDTLRLLGII